VNKKMRKYLTNDGYIQFNKNGNTYYGSIAQRLMLIAQKEYRNNKKLNVSFNDVLKACCYGLDKITKR